ncbi:MAG: SDR family oxidoreductase, partial [Myxococcales bacterium]|nr:SDR family oxidoreductase [Myxococcales bacterium]
TAQMVRLALEADASLFHVSTAYVCGAAAGFVPEEVRSEAPPFQNAYERSKWDAEHHVWSARAQGLRAAILRPSIVIGAAPDGRTVQFQGFYLLGWALSRICRRLARAGLTRPWLLEGITLPTDLTGPVNLVTVDYIGAAITHLALAKNSTGAVYHLTHPQPLSVAQVYGVLAEHYGFVVTPDAAGGAAPVSDRSTFTRSFQRVWDTLRPYFTTTPRFDTTHTRSALEPSGIAPPAVTPRLLHRMLDFADAQGFGRL